MDNVADELTIALKVAFNRTSYAASLSLNDNFWSVIYLGKFNVDFSFRGLIGLSKMLHKVGVDVEPQGLYDDISKNVDLQDVTLTFKHNNLNFVLGNTYIRDKLEKALNSNITKQVEKDDILNIIVDFSSPNVAKDMHVGHLRSTIIGDIICRYFEELGHNVYRTNHIGDFGLPFGMIIQCMYEDFPNFKDIKDIITISNLQQLYANSKIKFEQDDEFKRLAYQRVVQIQSGDPDIVEAWEFIKDVSRRSYDEIYKRLNISLTEVGESFYQGMIPSVVQELEEKDLLTKDDGRLAFNIEGYEYPLTVVKSDGGYTYDTTDLAAIRYRLVDLNVDRVYYVVGQGQREHFEMIFKAAELAGWKKKDGHELHHIGFGLILDETTGKPFKSRDGGTIKLVDLLDEGLDKARGVIEEKSNDLTSDEIDNVTKSVAYSAIKYHDLASSRLRDYKFSYDNMLSLKGNTSVYLLYAFTRIQSILRNIPSNISLDDISDINKLIIEHKNERDLSMYIIQFPDVFDRVGKEFNIHYLCDYLYKLSTTFHNFFTTCRCIFYAKDRETVIDINESRLLLCLLTQKVMAKCLHILNIQTLDRM